MAVTVKEIRTNDTRSGKAGAPIRTVNYIKILKGNRKGAAAACGGQLYDHADGSFHINLVTKVNGKVKTLTVGVGDVVFRTGTSNRWQVITKKGFQKRFPQSKI